MNYLILIILLIVLIKINSFRYYKYYKKISIECKKNDDLFGDVDQFFENQDKENFKEIIINYKKIMSNNDFNDKIFDNEPEIDDSKPLYCVIGDKNTVTKNLLYNMKKLNLKFFFFPKLLFSKEDLQDVFKFDENSEVRVYKDQELVGDLFDIYSLLYGFE
jgi:hypothetical protein